MIKGIWIEFPIEIRKSHLCTLNMCYSSGLKWMHEQELAPACVEKMAQSTINSTLEEFLLEIELCVHMLKSIQFPSPVSSHVMPHVFSRCNVMKGRSNATTKLLDFCQTFLPMSSFQS